jgi:hypothetical protein
MDSVAAWNSPDPYGSSDVILRLNNADSEKLGYLIYDDDKEEAKPLESGDPLQLNDRVDDMRFILRMRPWDGASVQALGGARWREEYYDSETTGIQGSYQGYDTTLGLQAQIHAGRHSLTLSAGRFTWLATPEPATIAGFTQQVPTGYAVQADLHSQWWEALSTDLSYGRAPFSQDIMNSSWVNLDPETTLRLDGSF